MNQFTFETQGTNTFLVYEISPTDEIDTVTLGMLTNNRIPGLAQTIFTQINDSKRIKFNISSHMPASQFLMGKVKRDPLMKVLQGITDALLIAEEYMIDNRAFVLDLDYIYVDVSTAEPIMICLPIEVPKASTADFGGFFRSTIFSPKMQFDQSENCNYVTQLFNYLNGAPVFTLVDFRKTIDTVLCGAQGGGQAPHTVQSPQKPMTPPHTPVTPSTPQKPVTPPATVATSSPTSAPAAPMKGGKKEKVASPPHTPAPIPPHTPAPIPPQKTTPVPPAAEEPEEDLGEPISFGYLMQHYNKENAERYKRQQEAKKKKKSKPMPTSVSSQPASGGYGFAVPGQATPQQTEAPRQTETPQKSAPQPPRQQPQQFGYAQTSVPQPGQGFGETTVLGGVGVAGETTCLSDADAPAMFAPHLIRLKTKTKISIDQAIFHIGSDRNYANYAITDNSTVSHAHANFVLKGKAVFVVDCCSRNHTFLNGTMIPPNQEMPLSHGDIVRLSNEDFEFRLY